MQKITPFLWFNENAEEAVDYYMSIFKNSEKGAVLRYGKGSFMPEGMVMTIDFFLDGQQFTALNGGPMFTFSPDTSLVVNCETQEEIDYYWDKLSEGGQKQQCGWLQDKFGVSWQVVPIAFIDMMTSGDEEKIQRVTQAMLAMEKLDIAILKSAYDSVD